MPPGTGGGGGIQKLNFFVKIASQRQTFGQSVGLAADKTLSLSLVSLFLHFWIDAYLIASQDPPLSSAFNANNNILHGHTVEIPIPAEVS